MLEHLIFQDLVVDFLNDVKSRGRSKKTQKFYKDELGYFVKWLGKNRPDATLETLTPTDLRSWFADLGQTRNPGGIACNYRAVRALLNWLEFEYELTWKNPIKKVRITVSRNEPLPEIPLGVIRQLLDACAATRDPLRNRSILQVLVDTGARASELTGLDCGDVDLDSGSVYIRHGKGNKKRVTFLGKSSAKALRAYLASRDSTDPDSPLFLNEDENRLQFGGLRMLVLRLCHYAGVKVFGLHSFRRTCALTLYRRTHDIFFVSRYLGHGSPDVTRRYLNLSGDDLRDSFKPVSPADMLGD